MDFGKISSVFYRNSFPLFYLLIVQSKIINFGNIVEADELFHYLDKEIAKEASSEKALRRIA
jgi:hypothetical protein